MRIIDPLAQSFFIEDPNGIFATSIDIFFYSKDNTLPVTLQLRSMQLGLPTDIIYPFSEVTIDPILVSVDTDGSQNIPTRFRFPSPVYLEGNKFHSIVLLSNSENYKVWVSELGKPDLSGSGGLYNTQEFPQAIVTKQPLTGGLFQSQNASSWVEQPYEDLKFELNRANFTSNIGNINFYNPELALGNNQIATLLKDSLNMNSRLVRVGLGTTISDTNLKIGNTIIQKNSNLTGNYVGNAGKISGNLQIVNAGIGYTPISTSDSFTFNSVSLSSLTGNGLDATANITINGGVAVAATITSGGRGYVLGDILTADSIGSQGLGQNLRLSVSEISGINELILDNVQGSFSVGAGSTLYYIDSVGITSELNLSVGGNIIVSSENINVVNDGLHIKVNHKNHGMHARENQVQISNARSDVRTTTLQQDYSSDSSTNISIASTTNFSTFENIGVGASNPGYILIGNEIISYTGVVSNALTGITRGIDNTISSSYTSGVEVMKYELNGISLRRINKTHLLQNSAVSDSIDLDYYTIKIDNANFNGLTLPQGLTERSGIGSLPSLYTNETKSAGGAGINATQNIQFETIRPNVHTLILNKTNISSQIRTISGRSVSGQEISFEDRGFEPIDLNSNNYLDAPRIVASKLNEDTFLDNIQGNKSLTMSFTLESSNSKVSPVIDLDRVSLILSTNRVNAPITDYAADLRVSSIKEDPNAFVYVTKHLELEIPATSISLLFAAYVNTFSDVRAFYSITNDPSLDPIFYPFPGFRNLNNLEQVINDSASDGLPNQPVPKTDVLSSSNNPNLFRDYEFSIDNLDSFRFFSIKIVGTSTNQAFPPRIKDLRVLALAPSY